MNWLPKLSILITLLLVSFSAQSSTLIKDATILTLAEGSDKPFTGYILIDEGNITAIEQGVYDGKADTVIDAAGKIIIPGFLSGHSHLWQSAFRGLAADKTLFPWLKALHWTYGDYFSKGDFYTFTLDGALDQLAHGITTTYNHSQRLGASEQDYMESLYASIDSGQHFIFSYNSDLSLSKEELTQHFSALNKQAEQLKKTTSLLAFSVNAVGYYGHKDKFPLELKLAKK
jgi:5-methylthioadenosine/S-adenosylhomocysteine deaminase